MKRRRRKKKGFVRSHRFYTKPDQELLSGLSDIELSHVDDFVIGNEHGEVRYIEPVNLR